VPHTPRTRLISRRVLLLVATGVALAVAGGVWKAGALRHESATVPSACAAIREPARRDQCVDDNVRSQLARDRAAHVKPSEFTSMSLTAYPKPDKPGEAGCATIKRIEDRERCFGDVLMHELNTDVPLTAAGQRKAARLNAWLDALDERAIGDAPLHDACHQAMHLVGYDDGRRFARAGKPVRLPARSARLCHSGYSHGLVEGYMTHSETIDLALIYQQLCVDKKAAAVCAHGIGHSLMLQYQMRTDGTTPADGGMDKSIARCFDLPGPARHPYARAYDCANGAYMQRAMQQPAIAAHQFQQECRQQRTSSLRDFCYHYIAMNEFAHGASARDAAEVCVTKTDGHERECAIGLGNLLGADRIDGCNSFGDELLRLCYVGAFILAVDVEEITADQAPATCELNDTVDRKVCREALPEMNDAIDGLAEQDHD
jgi:hypothetical protein